ncbi:Ig-like domain-containing protein [Mycolicibacterium sp. F2034L]|uniref:Ig-like domain-containing protein n=1 Tax=Mycolicibacterium sp. F2034L TaxID=2926422 RepID=UPI001FF3283F|nr:Ig-like domain-containing protein [Mycolicibacterium sp. F2034L]MCK0177268.1 tandem-95 repeat protein [Mycolicibacterium sp. F2034L]
MSVPARRVHQNHPSEGYARYVGRVGALAVALGVGMAITSAHGVGLAHADPGAISVDRSDSGNTSGATASEGSRASDNAGTRDVGESPSRTTALPSDEEAPSDRLVESRVRRGGSAGATHGLDATALDSGALDDAAVERIRPFVFLDAPIRGREPRATVTAGESDTRELPGGFAESRLKDAGRGPSTGVETARLADGREWLTSWRSSPAAERGRALSTWAASPVATTPDAAFEATAPVTSFVSAVLTPFVGVAGRTAPAQPLSVWTMLNLLGREMQRTWFNRRPQIRDQHHHVELGDARDVSQRIPLGGFDPDGDVLQYSVAERGEAGGPRFGTVTIDQATGTYTYDPDDSFARSGGTDTFVVRLADSSPRPLHRLLALLRGGNTDFAVVNVTVAPVRTPPPPVNTPPVKPPPVDPPPADLAPVAIPDSFRMDENTSLTGNVLTNDIDQTPDDDTALTVEMAAGPTHGSLTLNKDGSFTYKPDANFSGRDSFDYRVVHGSVVGNVTTATIIVAAPVDGLVVELPAGGLVTGVEDSAIALGIKVSSRYAAEALKFTIAGVPDGAALSSGADAGAGRWTLDGADLDGLTVTPPTGFSGSFDLTVTVTTVDGSTATAVLTVAVEARPDVPVVQLPAGGGVTGAEDSAIALGIAVSTRDPEEAVTVTIQGVPDGAVLSSGADNGDGSWTLDRADLAGLTVTPPVDFAGSFDLTVTAVGTDGSAEAAVLTVTVEPVTDPPALELPAGQVVIGREDSAIALGINVSSGDSDETVTVRIEGVPEGAVLSAGADNGDGTWTLTAAEAANVSISPAQDYFGTFTLAITATATDSSGAVASTAASLVVDVVNVGDIPQLQLPGDENQIVTGREGAPLDIGFAVVTPDVGSDVTITIGEVPADAVLSAGIDNGDGTWTLTADEAADLSITMPEDYSGWFGLTIFAEVRDAAGEGGSIFTSLVVDFRPVADVPAVELPDGGLVTGAEDTSIALGLNVSSPDPIEMVTVTIGGVPAGAVLSAGFDNGDGSWTVRADEVPGLTLTPAPNFSGDFDLTVTAIAVDADGGTATTTAVLTVAVTPVADVPWLQVEAGEIRAEEGDAIALGLNVGSGDPDETVTVTIDGLPDGAVLSAGTRNIDGSWTVDRADVEGLAVMPPSSYAGTFTLNVTATATDGDRTATVTGLVTVYVTAHVEPPVLQVPFEVTGAEDSAIALGIKASTDDPDESVAVFIAGVPVGAKLSRGSDQGDGTWLVEAHDLSNLTITPPADSADDFILTIWAVATEGGQSMESVPMRLRVTVNAVADASTAWGQDVRAGFGDPIGLVVGGQLADTDGSETLTYRISGVPDGFSLNQGINNGDNSWTLRQEQLADLRLVAPHRFQGSLALNVTPVAHDEDGSTAAGEGSFFVVTIGAGGPHVDIEALRRPGAIGVGVIVDGVEVDSLASSGELGTPEGVFVREGGQIDGDALLDRLRTSVGLLMSGFELSGLPDGTIVNGTTVTNGRWMSGGILGLPTDGTLDIVLPPDADADFLLRVTTFGLLGMPTTVVTTPVTVMASADPVAKARSVAVDRGDGTVALNIDGELTDTDGSETLSYLISGVPAGFRFNQGIDNGNGTWSLTAEDRAGLVLTPPADWAGPYSVKVVVSHIVTEREGDQAVVQTGASVTVSGARSETKRDL